MKTLDVTVSIRIDGKVKFAGRLPVIANGKSIPFLQEEFINQCRLLGHSLARTVIKNYPQFFEPVEYE